MGCSSSKPIEMIEITSKCEAPGVKFEEQIIDIEGCNRNTASWFPVSNNPKAIVFISHGLNEHALCYYNVAIALVNAGYGVFAIDHVSHGKSDGPRGVILDHNVLYNDFVQFANTKRKLYAHLPAFVVAHSMGTLIALMSINRIENIKALVLSGCAIVPGPDAASPFGIRCLYPLGQTACLQSMLSVTSVADPKGIAAPLVEAGITSNPEYVASLKHDPRRNGAFVTNKTAYEVLLLTRKVKEEVPKLTIPFFCIHGGDDLICMTAGSEFVYTKAGTDITQRKYQIIPGSKHECFHETPPRDTEAIKMVVDFIELHYNTCDVPATKNNAVVSVETDEGDIIDRPISTFIPGAPRAVPPPQPEPQPEHTTGTIPSSSEGVKASNNSLSSLNSEKTVHADDIMVVIH